MIFVNYKTYKGGTGTEAISLARVFAAVSRETGVRIVSVVQSADIKEISSLVDAPIWSQHVDLDDFGAHTGSVLPEAVREDGAVGTFLNHSEHKFKNFNDLKKAHTRAVETGLETLLFAGDIAELKEIVKLKPNFVSYEPPELVGSKTTSVAKATPEIITKAVEIAKKHDLPLIVGAGIKSTEDVRVSLERGAVGIAVASAVVDSHDPKGEIMKLIEGFG
jgi:triosephosphate isomerase